MTDTFISGCGVFPDAALPDGTRLRLSPTGNPAEDVEVYVEDGHIHFVGHYTRLHYVERVEDNHLVVNPVKLPGVLGAS